MACVWAVALGDARGLELRFLGLQEVAVAGKNDRRVRGRIRHSF